MGGVEAFWRIFVCVIGCVFLTACAMHLPPPLPGASTGGYRLSTGDTIRVLVYNQQSLSNDFTVADDGTISVPMVGALKARGLTAQELEKDLYRRLDDGILVKPGVSIQLVQTRPVFVVGEVSKPGQYGYLTKLNVLGAVAAAGGFTVRADRSTVTVVRAVQDHPAEWTAGMFAELQPGDVVIVREQFF
ncbi:MAG TPA: polysaccharide biosynthesis/export family protein [Rhizomicrobium sp.]|nr:polysaccharide biosynthesis/export family protein [Rhizomicrobium sp.]